MIRALRVNVCTEYRHMHWQQQQPQEISHFKGFPSPLCRTLQQTSKLIPRRRRRSGKTVTVHSRKKTQIPPPPRLSSYRQSVFSRMASRVDFVSSAAAFPSRGQQQQQQQQQRRFRSSNRVHISPAAAAASLQEAAAATAAAAAAGDPARVHTITKSAAAASPLPRSENP